tara:strand:+ start:38 stop:622 length:585 start_codon:yes stop_codon:yes gene_type:complete
MSSIIRADTIQDLSGNNIINESGNTITIGASGDTTNIVGTLQNNGASVSSVAGTVVFTARSSSSQSVSDNTHTQVTLGTEILDTDNAFSSSAFTVPSGKGGNYLFNGAIRLRDTNNTITAGTTSMRVNGTQVANEFTNRESFSYDWNMRNLTQQSTAILNLSAGDVVTLYGYISSSNTSAQTFDQAQFMGVRLS